MRLLDIFKQQTSQVFKTCEVYLLAPPKGVIPRATLLAIDNYQDCIISEHIFKKMKAKSFSTLFIEF